MSSKNEEILLIAENTNDVRPIHQFLENKKYQVNTLIDVTDFIGLPELESASVILVDLSMKTSTHVPVYRWLHTHTKGEIIGLCERLLADFAKTEVKSGYLNDYLIINPQYDIGRIEFMIKRIMETRKTRQASEAINERLDQLEKSLSSGTGEAETIQSEIQILREHMKSITKVVVPGEARTPKVLIASEKENTQQHLMDVLKSAGYLTTLVSSGEEAVNSARAQHPHLIFMDVNTSGLNGFEAINLLRRDRNTAHIPVMIVSDSATEEIVLKAKQAQVDGFLTLPIRQSILSERVRDIFFREVAQVA